MDEQYESQPESRPMSDYPAARTNPFVWSPSTRKEVRASVLFGVAAGLISYFALSLSLTTTVAVAWGVLLLRGVWFMVEQKNREKKAAAWQMGFDQGWSQAREDGYSARSP